MDTLRSVVLFVAAALAEIGGAWLVWQGVREHRGWVWIGAGVLAWADGNLAMPDDAACRGYARTMFSWEAGITRLADAYRGVLA